MTPLQIRILVRHSVKDQIQKLKNARERLKAVEDENVDLLGRVADLETKAAAVKAALIDHETRIAALEGGS